MNELYLYSAGMKSVCSFPCLQLLLVTELLLMVNGEFLEMPMPVNATLGDTVGFRCTIDNGVVRWFVDGEPARSASVQLRGVEFETVPRGAGEISTLHIEASERNNCTTVQCASAIWCGDRRCLSYSPPVELKVQGLLSSPGNLAIGPLDTDRLILTWDPPFTLDVTSQDPDISTYTVYNNFTDTSVNTSASEYVMQNPCKDVEYEVSAWNQLGEGNRSKAVYIFTLKEYAGNVSLNVHVQFNGSGMPVVRVIIQMPGYHHYDPCLCKVLRLYLSSSNATGFHLSEWSYSIQDTDAFANHAATFYVRNLPLNKHITAVLTADGRSTLESVTFSTFDVSMVEVDSGEAPGSVCVTCLFSEGAQAQGCKIIITRQGGNPYVVSKTLLRRTYHTHQLEQNVSECVMGLKEGENQVLVYDVERDGVVDLNSAAVSTSYEVSLLPSSAVAITTSYAVSLLHGTPTPTPTNVYITVRTNSTALPNKEPDELSQHVIAGLILGTAVGSCLLVTGAIPVLTIFIVHISKRKRHCTTDKGEPKLDVEMKRNNAYQLHSRSSKAKIHTNPNSAYGVF